MTFIKVRSVIGSSVNSFGDKLTALVGTDGKFYYVSMMEGWHKDIKEGNEVTVDQEITPNENGLIDMTFIFNQN